MFTVPYHTNTRRRDQYQAVYALARSAENLDTLATNMIAKWRETPILIINWQEEYGFPWLMRKVSN
jgi:uncharacterized membrane protein